ncbi:hypothetical protein GL272_14130 [Aeromonas veronii]|uniref:hypothetical protein n=1 Tax=Aeromonas veronii TaxID=654 RepID=UPI0013027A51|nr:hypothetical protein [Aeromonas veronii]KAE9625306.1 hypothetical protein GO627_07880 [Aeromonas veronii]MBW3778043.1 hypothetical protein [Aeromonas veronii]
MSKDNTEFRLEAALQRVLDGQPERILDHRKLSVRAVEEEANLGNGSGYYYPAIIEKIKAAKVESRARQTGIKPTTELDKVREQKRQETKVKEKYRNQRDELLMDKEQMAAVHHQLSYALRKAQKRIADLERELDDVKQQLTEARRAGVVAIK